MDLRKFNGAPRKLTPRQVNILTDTEVLQRQCHMTLRERVVDLRNNYNINISYSVLRTYYIRNEIKFTSVDLITTTKIRRAREI